MGFARRPGILTASPGHVTSACGAPRVCLNRPGQGFAGAAVVHSRAIAGSDELGMRRGDRPARGLPRSSSRAQQTAKTGLPAIDITCSGVLQCCSRSRATCNTCASSRGQKARKTATLDFVLHCCRRVSATFVQQETGVRRLPIEAAYRSFPRSQTWRRRDYLNFVLPLQHDTGFSS